MLEDNKPKQEELEKIIEKVKRGEKITPEEFKQASKNIDWTDWVTKVTEHMCRVADAHELAQARSRARARIRVVYAGTREYENYA